MERIDDEAVAGIVGVQILLRADEEVTGEVDALGADAGSARDLDVDEAERDRNAGPPIEHLVEAAVPRIVVAIAVAGEPQLGEQVLVERVDAGDQRRVVAGILGNPLGRRVAHLVEPIEIRTGIEMRIFEPRDQKRRRGQVGSRAVRRVRQLLGERPRRAGHRDPPRARSGWTGADSQSRSSASSVSA